MVTKGRRIVALGALALDEHRMLGCAQKANMVPSGLEALVCIVI
jgi:hypothetical protein